MAVSRVVAVVAPGALAVATAIFVVVAGQSAAQIRELMHTCPMFRATAILLRVRPSARTLIRLAVVVEPEALQVQMAAAGMASTSAPSLAKVWVSPAGLEVGVEAVPPPALRVQMAAATRTLVELEVVVMGAAAQEETSPDSPALEGAQVVMNASAATSKSAGMADRGLS